MSITEKLNGIIASKSALKDAINQKGGSLTDEKLSEYAAAVLALESEKTYDFETYIGGEFSIDYSSDESPNVTVDPDGVLEYYDDGGTVVFTAIANGVCTVTVSEGYLGEGEYETVTEYEVLVIAQSGTDTSDADAAAGDILQGKSAYVNGEKVTGTIETYAGETV